MHITFLWVILFCGLLFTGCGRRQVETVTSESTGVEELSDSALQLLRGGGSFGDVAAIQEQAIAKLRVHGSPQTVYILSKAGYLYCRMGDYARGLAYLQEANDSLRVKPESDGAIELKGNLANLYTRFGLYEEALKTNREGYALALKTDSTLASDFLRFRAETFVQLKQPDSVLACFRQAYRLSDCRSSEYAADARAFVVTCRASFIIDNYKEYPDSILPTVAALQSVPDSVGSNGMRLLYLGRGYFLTGKHAEGLTMMRKALELYKARDDNEMVAFILRMLLQSQAEQGMDRGMGTLFTEYAVLNDTLIDRDKCNAILGAEFRYQTAAKEEQLKVMEENNRLHRRTILYQWIIIVIGIVAVVMGIRGAVRYVRRMRRLRVADSERISQHIAREANLQTVIDDLDAQIKMHDSKKNIEEVTSKLDSSLLNDKGEKAFRRAFTTLYPRFLTRLRDVCPQLTSSNELVCMLIYLRLSNEEIAQCLGITRMSVNSARYLIRKKLNLDKATDLNDYICSLDSVS